jgi:hypothetical protein
LAKQPAQDYRGRVSGRFDVSGLVEDRTGEALTGEGAIRIKDGRVFMLPLFGGLSQALARVIPGLDFVLRQTDARAEFVIRNREARSTEIQVEGDVLSLTGRGAYRFDGGLDFYAQVQLMKHQTLVAKVLRTLTYPLSKLFEFRLRGTLDEPDWYPLNFSPELFERLGLKAAEEDGGAAPPEPPAADDGGE